MQNMQQYHDHYLLTDVHLLADVFEYFQKRIISEHNLDCLHFITLPSLVWAMALKYTGVKLDLITDPDAYLMLENSLRGGIATISQRYSLANNPLDPETYDDSQPNRYITSLDANSLYATAQCEPLPVGKFSIFRRRRNQKLRPREYRCGRGGRIHHRVRSRVSFRFARDPQPVSYTHLTLPTKRIV